MTDTPQEKALPLTIDAAVIVITAARDLLRQIASGRRKFGPISTAAQSRAWEVSRALATITQARDDLAAAKNTDAHKEWMHERQLRIADEATLATVTADNAALLDKLLEIDDEVGSWDCDGPDGEPTTIGALLTPIREQEHPGASLLSELSALRGRQTRTEGTYERCLGCDRLARHVAQCREANCDIRAAQAKGDR